tara:strand:- start:1498 stop:2094 length:597 start_codon:yes stop_codon:yes gene_type:complete
MSDILEQNNIDVFAIYSLGIMGVVMSTFFTDNNNDYGTVIGNSVIIITSVILIFMILYVYKFNNKDIEESDNIINILGTINNISVNTIINQGLPILLLIVALVYITILNIMFKDKNQLPGYALYNSLFQYIVIIQLLLIYKTSWSVIVDHKIDHNTESNFKNNKINLNELFIIIVGVINLTIAMIIHIILKSYSISDQ